MENIRFQKLNLDCKIQLEGPFKFSPSFFSLSFFLHTFRSLSLCVSLFLFLCRSFSLSPPLYLSLSLFLSLSASPSFSVALSLNSLSLSLILSVDFPLFLYLDISFSNSLLTTMNSFWNWKTFCAHTCDHILLFLFETSSICICLTDLVTAEYGTWW